jgi:hypothetical protein
VESRENTYLQVNLRIRAVSGLTNDLASLDARFVTFVCNSGSCEKGFNVEFLFIIVEILDLVRTTVVTSWASGTPYTKSWRPWGGLSPARR